MSAPGTVRDARGRGAHRSATGPGDVDEDERPLPDDPDLHACVLTYLSDMGPTGAVRRALGGWGRGSGMTASLDHCVWFHQPARVDEWLLYRLDALRATGARGVAKGELWTADGALAVTGRPAGSPVPPTPPLTDPKLCANCRMRELS